MSDIRPRLLKNWVICCNRPMEPMRDHAAYQCRNCSGVVTYQERLAMEGATPTPVDISSILTARVKE
jgi:hypothetical protein